MKLVIGHSWVRRLAELYICEDDFVLLGRGGATFRSIEDDVRKFFRELKGRRPEVIFVFLGSNDLDRLEGTAEVYKVTADCEALCGLLRQLSPGSKLVISQVEDRYARNHLENSEAVLSDFRAKSNKFNKWLNKYKGKDAVFILKGRKGFSDPSLYGRDGVHLNYEGNMKFAQRLSDF